MSMYTEVLEFFMENNVQLGREQLEELKSICNEGALKRIADSGSNSELAKTYSDTTKAHISNNNIDKRREENSNTYEGKKYNLMSKGFDDRLKRRNNKIISKNEEEIRRQKSALGQGN